MSSLWKRVSIIVGIVTILLVLVACQSPVAPSPTVDEVPTTVPTSTVEEAPTIAPTPTVEELPTIAPPTTVDQVLRITARELKIRLDEGQEVLVVDARSAESYGAKHISGAVSMPSDELPVRYGELPTTGEIVFY